MHIEVFKLFAQLVIVGGIGGAASLLYQEIAEARQKQDQETRILRETLSTLIQIYNECKCARRNLRATAIRRRDDGAKIIVRDPYSLFLTGLNDVQLKIGFYKRYVALNPPSLHRSQRNLSPTGDCGEISEQYYRRVGEEIPQFLRRSGEKTVG
jgi:hypothetical protein